ncbi:FAS-associated death domain protein [Peromyscus maniculatus bairdii]|uniref:FAS-associated death domain protein n=1 Tax=Peromyscus maniculatus bairdii TaxID=230844 RepID=A0A6I9LDY1_PERMB|nr:FAS-associated death domain protein [Peromyscus maniculatus bairdii]
MDPFLVLLHSLSGSLSNSDLMELKFLCRERVGKRKLERVQSGLDLFSVLLEQNDLERARTGLLRELLASLRRHDLLQRLDDFEAGTAAAASPGEADLRVAFDIVCDNVGRDWKRLARQLKLSEAKIDGVEERYPRSLSDQVRETLRVWKIAEREQATVAGLVKALRGCRLNLVADLVEEAVQAQGSVSESEVVSPVLWDPTVSSSEAL